MHPRRSNSQPCYMAHFEASLRRFLSCETHPTRVQHVQVRWSLSSAQLDRDRIRVSLRLSVCALLCIEVGYVIAPAPHAIPSRDLARLDTSL